MNICFSLYFKIDSIYVFLFIYLLKDYLLMQKIYIVKMGLKIVGSKNIEIMDAKK
jgi:hypothetical protein